MGTALRPKAKLDHACALVSQIAYSLGPDARMPTFATLCAQAQVSKATMDAALGQLEAEGILSRKQGSGIFVSPDLRQGIALICDPRFSIEPRLQRFWELIVGEARLRVAGTHYDLAFHFSTLDPEPGTQEPALHPGLMDDIRAGRVQGVLTVGVPVETVDWISEEGVAVVAFAGEGPVSVNLDNADLVELGVDALMKAGCRRLALWLLPEREGRDPDETAVTAFRRSLAARGLQYRQEWVRPQPSESSDGSSFDQALEWTSELFGAPRERWPDGLLVTNDNLTRDVMLALQRHDILPKRDLVVASHANSGSPVLSAYEGDLTLVEYDSAEIVQAMFDRLETLLGGEPLAEPHIRIKPKVRV